MDPQHRERLHRLFIEWPTWGNAHFEPTGSMSIIVVTRQTAGPVEQPSPFSGPATCICRGADCTFIVDYKAALRAYRKPRRDHIARNLHMSERTLFYRIRQHKLGRFPPPE